MLISRVVRISQNKTEALLDYTIAMFERSARRTEPDREVSRYTIAIPKAATIKQVSDTLVTLESTMK